MTYDFRSSETQQLPLNTIFSKRVILLPWLGAPGDGVTLFYDGSHRKQWINQGDVIARFQESPDSKMKQVWLELTGRYKVAEIKTPVSGLLLQIPDGLLYPFQDEANDNVCGHRVAILLPEGDMPSVDALAWFEDCFRLRDRVTSCLRTQLTPRPTAEYEYISVDSDWFLPILEAVRDSWGSYPNEQEALPIIEGETYFAFAVDLEARGDKEGGATDRLQDYMWAEQWYKKALTALTPHRDAESALARIAKKRLAL